MKKNFLITIVLSALLGVPTLSNAGCRTGVGWHCYLTPEQAKNAKGECKTLNCQNGCSEGERGGSSHCCSEPTRTNCRGNVYDEGCLVAVQANCLPNQRCNEKGICQDK